MSTTTSTHDQLLGWFGPEKYRAQLDAVRRFWAGEGRYVVSIHSNEHDYRQTFDDALVRREAPAQFRQQAELPGMNLPSLFPDFGTISTAKHWGGQIIPPRDGAMIYIEPVAQSVEEALAIEPRCVDDPDLDAARAARLYKEVADELRTDALWMRTPDMQGVLNTAGLVLQQEALLMAMYEEPEAVHRFLDRVCDLLIEYVQYLHAQTGGKLCGNIWPYTFLPAEYGISLTEDLMPLLPTDLYETFSIRQLRRLDEAFGGLHIHCCGRWGHHANTLAEADLNIRAVECHYPATPVEAIEPLADRAVFVPYLIEHQQDDFSSLTEYWRWLLDNTPETTRFWFAAPADTEACRQFAEEYGAFG